MVFIIKHHDDIDKIIFVTMSILSLLFTNDKRQIDIIIAPFKAILFDDVIIKHVNISAIDPYIVHVYVHFRETPKHQPEEFVFLVIAFHDQKVPSPPSALAFILIHSAQTLH